MLYYPWSLPWLCCRKRDRPFPGPKCGSYLTFRNELSEETHVLTKQETLLTSRPFPLSFLSLTLPILPRFSSPLVLDAGIWLKGLSLSWGLETDHLLLAENSNSGSVLVWFLVGPSSSPPFSGGPAGDVCKATPFAPLSLLLPLLLSIWLPFLPLKCLKTWDIFIYSVSTWIWSSVSL